MNWTSSSLYSLNEIKCADLFTANICMVVTNNICSVPKFGDILQQIKISAQFSVYRRRKSNVHVLLHWIPFE